MESRSPGDFIVLVSVLLLLLAQGILWLVVGIEQDRLLSSATFGAVFLLGAVAAPFARSLSPARIVLLFSSLALAVFFGRRAYFSPNFFLEFTEHALVFGSPAVLAMWWSAKGRPAARQLAIFLVAGTFLGHGLYALGWDRDATNFTEIVTTLTGLDQEGSNIFLIVFGVLDVLAVTALISGYFSRAALVYMAIWGTVTAFARLFFYLDPDTVGGDLPTALVETSYRLVHGLIPIWLMLMARKQE